MSEKENYKQAKTGSLPLKSWILLLNIAVLILIIAFIGVFFYKRNADKGNEYVATGKNFYITLNEADAFTKKMLNRNDIDYKSLNAEQRIQVVSEITITKVAVAAAKKAHLEKNKDVAQEITLRTEDVLKTAYLQTIASSSLSEETIRAEYDRLANLLNGQEELQLSQIVVASNQEAIDIRKTLTSKNFVQKVKDFSIDTATADQDGSLGYVLESNIRPEVKDAIVNLSVGSFSAPIETPQGWHIIYLMDKREAVIPSYQEASAGVAQIVAKRKVDEFVINSLQEEGMRINDKIPLPAVGVTQQ